MEDLAEKICPDWRSAVYYLHGPRGQVLDQRPTIMIVVHPGTKANWAAVEGKVASLDDKSNIGFRGKPSRGQLDFWSIFGSSFL